MLCLLLVLVCCSRAQFSDKPGNANTFVDQALDDLKKSGNTSIKLEDEKFILIIDLLLFKPELHLELRDGVFSGLNTLTRSSDALVTYDESTGEPVFSITSSLLLSNVSMVSAAMGKVRGGFGLFGITMPNIVLDVSVEGVDVGAIIDISLKDLANLKLIAREVELKDVGHVDVKIIGLTAELDTLVSPITTLVVNTVKRDIQALVTPLLKDTLQGVLDKNAPSDLSAIIG